jgi:ribosomal protein RSM22 (predicted rRNA methylase)
MQYYPEYFQDWLFEALTLKPGDEVSPALIEPLHSLHRTLTGSGDGDPDYADNAAAVHSYTCFYMPVNMPKLWLMLDRSGDAVIRVLEGRERIQLTELGCGPGTFLWSMLFYLRNRHPAILANVSRVTGIDQSARVLTIAGRLAKGLARDPKFAHIEFEFLHQQLDDAAPAGDIVIAGNVLNECGTDRLSAELDSRLLILIEPGTKTVFHDMLKVRDRIVDTGWQINFPCPSHHACPMAETNWCHFHINRFELPFIQRMANRMHWRNERHHFVGFVFSTQETAVANEWRVLSRLRKVHRSSIRYVCDGEHLVEAVLSRRDKTEANATFNKAGVGDAIVLTGVDSANFAKSKHIRKDDSIVIRS